MNRVVNLNHYPVNPEDERFGFLPFVGGLAVGALAGGGFGGRPCGPACNGMPYTPVNMMPTPQFVPVPIQTNPFPIYATQQPVMGNVHPFNGAILEANNVFIR